MTTQYTDPKMTLYPPRTVVDAFCKKCSIKQNYFKHGIGVLCSDSARQYTQNNNPHNTILLYILILHDTTLHTDHALQYTTH